MTSTIQWAALAICAASLAVAGCDDGKKTNADADATDTAADDSTTDDVATDIADTSPDPTPDGEDAPADSAIDTSDEDATGDDAGTETDMAGDPFEEWPTDLPSDWEHETSGECEAAGGFCSGARWILCPPGYENIGDPDPNLSCEVGGWCCVPAPPGSCSASGWTNCVDDTSCTGCWDDPPGPSLECEPGRVCCYDICD